ncbi:MAG: choline kinase, partial [Gammaproteobacteria bacterium]|nr:choline kinase [Gammaproteobacteria bacterium]
MNKHFQNFVLKTTGATAIRSQEVIQTLWSGYGEIVRVELIGSNLNSVVVKYIVFPSRFDHPRGWNTDHSHARKIKSYDVEMHWYRDWSIRCSTVCRVAQCYATMEAENERIILLEDLDAVGFPIRRSTLDSAGVKLCLRWLAHFHATFMSEKPEGLWQTGTYWHLATRPDEWAAMAESDLKQVATEI